MPHCAGFDARAAGPRFSCVDQVILRPLPWAFFSALARHIHNRSESFCRTQLPGTPRRHVNDAQLRLEPGRAGCSAAGGSPAGCCFMARRLSGSGGGGAAGRGVCVPCDPRLQNPERVIGGSDCAICGCWFCSLSSFSLKWVWKAHSGRGSLPICCAQHTLR